MHKWLLPGELLWKPGTGGGDNGQRLISGLRVSCCFSPQRRSDVWVFGSPPGDRRTKMPPSTGWALARDLGAQLPGWSRPKHPRRVKTKVGLTGRRRNPSLSCIPVKDEGLRESNSRTCSTSREPRCASSHSTPVTCLMFQASGTSCPAWKLGGSPLHCRGLWTEKGEELVAHLTSDKEMLWTHTLDRSPGKRLGAPREPHTTHTSSYHRRACREPGTSSARHLPYCM